MFQSFFTINSEILDVIFDAPACCIGWRSSVTLTSRPGFYEDLLEMIIGYHVSHTDSSMSRACESHAASMDDVQDIHIYDRFPVALRIGSCLPLQVTNPYKL